MNHERSTKAWRENDELFFQEARLGQFYAERIAERLRKAGLPAVAPKPTLRRNISDADNFKNTKDVICVGKTIEIKSRRRRFTTPLDFPFPTVIVDTVSGWRSKREKPFAYVIVSRLTDAAIWLPGGSDLDWKISRHFDRIRAIEDDFYEAPKRMWRSFDELIKALRK